MKVDELFSVSRVGVVVEDIGRFDIAVNNALAMEVFECFRHLTHESKSPMRANIMIRPIAEMFSLSWKQVFNVAPAKAEEHVEFPIGTKILEVMHVELGDVFPPRARKWSALSILYSYQEAFIIQG